MAAKLQLLLPPGHNAQIENHTFALDYLDPYPRESYHHAKTDPLSISGEGVDFTRLGCFHLGLEPSPKEATEILQTQRNLKDLNLLLRLKQEELHEIRTKIKAYYDAQGLSTVPSPTSEAVRELINLLAASSDDDDSPIQVYVGLHSGFQTSSGAQFWGLYDVEFLSGALNIYISGKTPDRVGTILHTFLSSRSCTRTECFLAELAMSEQHGMSETWQLPSRIVHDLEQLSPTETILFIKRLNASRREDESILLTRIRNCCNYQLIDVPTLTQLRAMNSAAYLRGEISVENLVTSRLAFLRERGCWHPDPWAAISLFKEVDDRLYSVLMNGESELLAQLGVVIQTIVQNNQIDAGVDIFALSVFSAFRKLALEEVYLEVLDRNPYPNHATDQAGCFAENFALGSRCDSFFDMTPRVLGRIISDKYRAYYMKYQPPPREEGFTELPTAYAAMQVDLDPDDGDESLPIYYHVTFFGIFAVPALIDVMLLTTTGRGLYLTTFMTSIEKTMATTALLLALLVCGAFGAWISSGGSYYFYASAFPTMNMFVLTRFVAGVAVALVGGLGAMIGIMVAKGVFAGVVFLFYFLMLTIYLMTLSALSIYQLPGSPFQSVSIPIISQEHFTAFEQ